MFLKLSQHGERNGSLVEVLDLKGLIDPFVSAVQDRYTVKKTSSSASVGVSPFGSISVPFQSGSDSMVKVASETIPAGRFYMRFFDLVEQFLAEQKGLDDRPGSAVEPAGAPPPARQASGDGSRR